MKTIFAFFAALANIRFFFEKAEQYIIEPIKKWNHNRKMKKIDTHYEAKQKRIQEINEQIDVERKKPVTEDSDEALRELTRKLQNLGKESIDV